MADIDMIEEWQGLGPHKVLEDAPSAVLVVRADGRIAYANRAAMTLFGYARTQFVGQPVDFLLPEDRRDKHSTYIAGWFKHPRPRAMGSEHLNIQGRNKNGDLLSLDIQLSPIETSKGVMAQAWIRELDNLSAGPSLHRVGE